ncbi:hypothetical protein COW98_02160 [Candidatus Roizmanbacteria bacterium CG22_combo_CG10-13_8_21_14_all_35_9]|nr:hypothetical protein [Candidatus Falkowbacteria bacterium]PIP14606.1 MAG: hypothetical protein COX47_04315 [Candidatus Roizmanbacteria bacterium CG23_combo_of_CG06-09_8_20_14_all_35_49]PIP62776.1 MAG: hypothetical protein COW98_02160 [Candidatus Roizmanbacteria bacterium CG22_combo_CG10-13_8_21_14_all_35_9]PIY71067.1 MAG: hypothetical protein COY88_02315 [Candidatus Roizmanbacteria bacterium CG_4_10_14_0_8_um_filter_35_28]
MNLPLNIRVNVSKCNKGKYHIELPEYNTHTEADNEHEIIDLVNDLIFCYFDVPSSIKNKIFYKPVREQNIVDIRSLQMLASPEYFKKHGYKT